MRRFIPLATQALLEADGDKPVNLPKREDLANALFSFLGAQSYPANQSDLFYRELQRVAVSDKGKDYTDLSLRERASVVRKVRLKYPKPPATLQQAMRARASQVERSRELMGLVSEESRNKLGELGKEIPSYKNTLQINGEDVPLTREQQDLFKRFLVEAYDREINTWNVRSLLNSTPDTRVKWLEKSLEKAKANARDKLIRQR